MIVLSLFDGASCCRLALNKANIKVDKYYASEIEKDAIENTQRNFPDTIQLGDVSNWREWDIDIPDLIIGGSPCFVKGTKIITKEGYKNIEQIKIGDEVLTHENRFRKVIDFGGKIGETMSLKAQGTLDVLTTKNHPFYVKEKKNKEAVWKKADEIKKGEYLGININSFSENPYNLDKETCWLLGRYIADGHYREDKRKERENGLMYQLIISVGKGKEEEFRKNINKRHFSFYDHSPSVKRACFSSKELVQLVKEIGIGKGASNKKISQVLLNLPKDLLKEVLEGYISGDCYKREDGRIKFSTVSEELALSLTQATIKCYGTPCMLSIHVPSKTKEIEGRIINQNKIFEGYFYKDVSNRRKGYFIEEDKMWVPFKKKEYLGNDFVYNMTVEEDNTYTANNIIVHNCQGFSRQGVGLNFEDPRSKLFFVYHEIVEHYKQLNPNLKFMLENVDMKKEWQDVITEHLGVEPMKINSDLFLPQNRPRTYWANFDIPKISAIQYSLLDYLDDIELDDYEIINGIKVSNDFTDKHKALVIRTDENELAVKQATKRGFIEFGPGDGVNLSFPTSKTRRGRVTRNRVGCLDTACNASVFDSKKQIRYLSINELERLQGLPVGYTDGMTESKAKKLIGNGWTVPVIAHILGGLK